MREPESGDLCGTTRPQLFEDGRRQGLQEMLLLQLRQRFADQVDDSCVALVVLAPMRLVQAWSLRVLSAKAPADVFAPTGSDLFEFGRQLGLRQSLLEQLRGRFGALVDAAIERRVATASTTQLELWLDRLGTASTPAEVVADPPTTERALTATTFAD